MNFHQPFFYAGEEKETEEDPPLVQIHGDGTIRKGIQAFFRCSTKSGERALWASVFAKGVFDAVALGERGALRWIESDDNRIAGFCWVCEALDLEPKAVREKVFSRELVRRIAYICKHQHL